MPEAKAAPPRRGFLFQEWLRRSPFWMPVACSLVNLTTWEQARPALRAIRRRWPTPAHLSWADPRELQPILEPLGLWRRRSVGLVRMANAWLHSEPACATDVLKLPGCGKYAHDSWAIFIDGRTDVEPNDGKLNWYIQERQTDGRTLHPAGSEQPPRPAAAAQ